MAIVGIISDTHGLLRDEAIEALKKSDLILHAGDVGMLEILEQLEQIAPVAAVRGNSHKSLAELNYGVLYLNPGSAGPRRFNLPVALAQLKIEAGRIELEIIRLKS